MSLARAAAPQSVDELAAQAWALGTATARRYVEFADVLQAHNNGQTASLFRSLADAGERRTREAVRQLGAAEPRSALAAAVLPPPPLEDAHYLMHPWHALHIAVQAQEQVCRYYGDLAQHAPAPGVREAAAQLQASEAQQLALLRGALAQQPEPPPDWADDPDPPRYTD